MSTSRNNRAFGERNLRFIRLPNNPECLVNISVNDSIFIQGHVNVNMTDCEVGGPT